MSSPPLPSFFNPKNWSSCCNTIVSLKKQASILPAVNGNRFEWDFRDTNVGGASLNFLTSPGSGEKVILFLGEKIGDQSGLFIEIAPERCRVYRAIGYSQTDPHAEIVIANDVNYTHHRAVEKLPSKMCFTYENGVFELYDDEKGIRFSFILNSQGRQQRMKVFTFGLLTNTATTSDEVVDVEVLCIWLNFPPLALPSMTSIINACSTFKSAFGAP